MELSGKGEFLHRRDAAERHVRAPLPNGAVYALEELAPAQWLLRNRFA